MESYGSVDIRTLLKKAPGTLRSVDGSVTADFSLEGRNVPFSERFDGKISSEDRPVSSVDAASISGLGHVARGSVRWQVDLR